MKLDDCNTEELISRQIMDQIREQIYWKINWQSRSYWPIRDQIYWPISNQSRLLTIVIKSEIESIQLGLINEIK